MSKSVNSNVPKQFKKMNLDGYESIPTQTIDSYLHIEPFIDEGVVEFYDNSNIVQPGYVRFVCSDEWRHNPQKDNATSSQSILQIREDIVATSNLLSFMASSRDITNLSEWVWLANHNATKENMKTFCLWVDQHIQFEERQAPDTERVKFDQLFIKLNNAGVKHYGETRDESMLDSRKDWLRWRQDDLDNQDSKLNGSKTPSHQRSSPPEIPYHRDYDEVSQLMNLGVFLEQLPYKWHSEYAQKKYAELRATGVNTDELPEHEKPFEFFKEICADVLGQMIASCETPIELQQRFPTLVGARALNANDKYYVLANDSWLHGDDHVSKVVKLLQEQQKQEKASARQSRMNEEDILKQYGKDIPEWNSSNQQRQEMLPLLGFDRTQPNAAELELQFKIKPVPIDPQSADIRGLELGAHWWG